MLSSIVVKICVVLATTIVCKIDAGRIGATDLLTDTNYQISDPKLSGFNLLTYASVYTKGGESFVQLDDHEDRAQKYASGGPWFQDGLWTFKLLNEDEPFVTIHHPLFPGYQLVVDGNVESPTSTAYNQHYLILSNSEKYNLGQDFYQNKIWDIRQQPNEQGIYTLQNLATHQYPGPLRFAGEYYKWVSDQGREYTYRIKAV